MVTSNKLPDQKVVKMSEQNNSIVVPQRTLLGEVNEHITCPLCRGYYIDATTIVECLHSFCRSCIINHLQVKSYCPVCEMMINSAKPNIKPDKALQDIVYKLVPGLFQKEMERRQQFYASRPGPAATATPEQRGEDTERIIFSPEDVISFSLEYADVTDTDSISSRSSDSNESQPQSTIARRFLQCPAVVNISHLKKFLSMKFDIDSTQFAIDILYKRVPLPDYYTLMDIAYIYNWKRNEPMRFFYQIIDYVAIRNRLYDINRNGSQFQDRRPSPTSTEDTNASSPAPNLNDQGSEASSGTDSPMPSDSLSKQCADNNKKQDKSCAQVVGAQDIVNANGPSSSKKNDDEVEKSQFLNSFELTAKNNCKLVKSSPVKSNATENISKNENTATSQATTKSEDTLKRKLQTPPSAIPEMKKLKIELEKAKIPTSLPVTAPSFSQKEKMQIAGKPKEPDSEISQALPTAVATSAAPSIESRQLPIFKQQTPGSPGAKRSTSGPQNVLSPKRKNVPESSNTQTANTPQKTVSPLKLLLPKTEAQSPMIKSSDTQKPAMKKIPDLKPSNPAAQNKPTKLRMDLLANNCDPTMDRSKIMSQVKSSLGMPSSPQASSGDPLKSLLFDSCKINIPSSLSITLTDQKDQRNPNDAPSIDPKKNVVNKNLAGATNVPTHKIPSPPVHNYIEILKLPDTDQKKQSKPENVTDLKSNTTNKPEGGPVPTKTPNKSSESSAKGPIPNLKPIDSKSGKQAAVNYSSPITFQQTFEQQVQSLQEKKPKPPKSKTQVPKLVPANPKTFNAANKLSSTSNPKPAQGGIMTSSDTKTGAALDLSTAHNIPSHLNQTKAFETMQSIVNLAKKQNLPSKAPTQLTPNFSNMANRPIPTSMGPLRIPLMSSSPQVKHDKIANPSVGQISNLRQDVPNKPTSQIKSASNANMLISSQNFHMSSLQSTSPAQPSPRSQTRSPSSSPKLVIAEDKQVGHSSEQSMNQSNQITSTQLANAPKSESPKSLPMPGPSKLVPKSTKPVPSANKITGIRQPITPTVKPNPNQQGLHLLNASSPQDYLRQQIDISAWVAAHTNTLSKLYKSFRKDKQ